MATEAICRSNSYSSISRFRASKAPFINDRESERETIRLIKRKSQLSELNRPNLARHRVKLHKSD
jgi:hypothetical protein